MFRRHWCGLPTDAEFPSDLEKLGYYVNIDDEIRSIDNPDNYFNFFLNKNERINRRQRFEFDRAVERIIHHRIYDKWLKRIPLPLEAEPDEPHVHVYVSYSLQFHSRVIIIFGEHTKALGLLASRIAAGPGGINKGSMVSVVEAIKDPNAYRDRTIPGIILANMGQLYWWHEGKEAITVDASSAIPLPSLVHTGTKHIPEVNTIPGNEDPFQHMESVLTQIVANECHENVRLDIIAIGESCETVVRFFDNPLHWDAWASSLGAMLFCSPTLALETLSNEGLKGFLATRTRGYLVSSEPIDTPLFGPNGSPNAGMPAFGFPCYSSGEPQLPELVFIKALSSGLCYLEEAAMDSEFENPPVVETQYHSIHESDDSWEQLPDDERPSVSQCDESWLMEDVKMLRRWRKFEETGEARDSDSYSDVGE